jgi:hypothetical protein
MAVNKYKDYPEGLYITLTISTVVSFNFAGMNFRAKPANNDFAGAWIRATVFSYKGTLLNCLISLGLNFALLP